MANDKKLKLSLVETSTENASCIVNFKGNDIPKSSTFKLYTKRNNKEYLKDEDYGNLLLQGENDRLEYIANTNSNDPFDYYLGVIDEDEKDIKVFKTSFLKDSKIISKSKKNLKGPTIRNEDKNIRMSTKRNALGEAFGTTKAKKAIADIERNRVDSEKLLENSQDIIDNVASKVSNLPTRDQMEQDIERPTPACNPDASDVMDIYPIENIVNKKLLSNIRLNDIISLSDEEILQIFPYSKSGFIQDKVAQFNENTPMIKWQLLYFTSLLFAIFKNKNLHSKEKLVEKFDDNNKPSDVLVDHILKTFTVYKVSSSFGRSKDQSFTIDPKNEDKIICHIVCAMLQLNGFFLEITPLAKELNLKPSKIAELLKIVGCQIKNVTQAQADALSLDKSVNKNNYKIASLKVPFRVPVITRRGARR
ncbi:hypothetical protein ACO0SA_002509 [Hanseniaspora valbyensis]